MEKSSRGLAAMLGLQKRRRRAPRLGARELALMEVLWNAARETTAQEVLEGMPAGDIGLSTVQSTLERLHRKQLVSRKKLSRAYLYRARFTRQELISHLLLDITREIAGGDMQPVISGFITYLEEAPGGVDGALQAALQQHSEASGDAGEDGDA